ncbi:hypothetical protein CDL15_Pgr006628 [Punica granatum]|nr:hypothetical protein CDL15_Pgr006628 [Punica granatum]
MFRSLFCGSSYGKGEDDDDDDRLWKNRTTPSIMPKRQMSRSPRENPYSSSGLDKFTLLLADLEERRQKIRSKHPEVTLVWFVYASSDDLVPIVVKAKSRNNQEETKRGDCARDRHVILTHRLEKAEDSSEATEEAIEAKAGAKGSQKSRLLYVKPSSYIAAVLILILISLAFFGRTVAILCSSAAWYAIPALRPSRSNLRNSKKKNQ